MSRNPDPGPKRQIGGELIIPVLALGFTAYYFSTILDSPWTAQVNAFLVGSVLTVLVLAFLAVCIRELRGGRATLGVSDLIEPRHLVPKRAGFIGLTLAYLVALGWLGFTLTTFVFLAGSMLLLGGGRRPALCLALSALMAGIGYAAFIALFETRLPTGPIETLLAAIF
ncbi:MAG: tripartite tricarboxylate transporter TctB family protein [Inquilinus sp.]|nr:tripartite tricarboxylate transporter TctB family protein [Inquilinus sp.]